MAVDLESFVAGNGINCNKLNGNFTKLQNQANKNKSDLQNIANDALLKDGSNLTPEIVNKFNQSIPVVLSDKSGTIQLNDNTMHYLSLSGNGTIQLPSSPTGQISHTISLIVQGSEYTLNLGTEYHLYQNFDIDFSQPYSVLYVYNKIDNKWYYYLTQ